MSKLCKSCNIKKNIDEFYKHKAVCKICHNQISKTYRENNKESISISRKKWELNNIESRKVSRKENARKRRSQDYLFSLRTSISRNIRCSLLRNGFKKNNKTEIILGCSFEEFKLYLESKFEPWMNWENRGLYNGDFNYGWDIDHIIPLSSGNSEEDITKLSHYKNLQPLCSKINREIKSNILDYK